MIVPNRKYTFAELEKLRAQYPDLARVYARHGYVWRMDLDGTMEMVHYTKATGGGGSFGQPAERPMREFAATGDPFNLDELPPIRKRTPQERIDSLMSKVSEDFKAGRVLTLDEVNTHREGRAKATELTGEVVKEVAQSFLERAEAES